jgi:hypothetical protein
MLFRHHGRRRSLPSRALGEIGERKFIERDGRATRVLCLREEATAPVLPI